MFAGCNKLVVFNTCGWVVHMSLPLSYVIWVFEFSIVQLSVVGVGNVKFVFFEEY